METLLETYAKGKRESERERDFAGLALLARDYYSYLKPKEKERKDAKWFLEAVEAVKAEELPIFGGFAFPDYNKQKEAGEIPQKLSGTPLAESAARGQPSIDLLIENLVVKEWTKFPGEKLFGQIESGIRPYLKQAICKSDIGPDRLLDATPLSVAVPFVVNGLASAGMIAAGAAGGFWLPILAYVSLVILKSGVKEYCKDVTSGSRAS